MSVTVSQSSRWPSRAAFLAAAILCSAQCALNVNYGLSKATDIPGKLVWGGVAAAVAIVLALAWPALLRSCARRDGAAVVACLMALVLCGSYSTIAALGAASGSRVVAERTEKAADGSTARAQAARQRAQDELDGLKAARPVAELEALVSGARPVCRVSVASGKRETHCAPPSSLVAELGRAKRKAELLAALERADDVLAKAPVAPANSDSAAIRRFLLALGLDVPQARLDDLLVILAVVTVEFGGGLALATGMALSGAPGTRQRPEASGAPGHPEHPKQPLVATPDSFPEQSAPTERHPHDTRTVRPSAVRAVTMQPSGVQDWLAEQGGKATTSMRRLASALGRSPSAVHDELRRLSASGAITVTTSPRGTTLALRPN